MSLYISVLSLLHCLLPQLFQACGNLREGGTSSTGADDIVKNGKVTVEDRLGTSTNKMEKLVSIYLKKSVFLLLSDGLIQPIHSDGL